MFDKFWKNALFTFCFGALGGITVLVIVAYLNHLINDLGSLADWFAAIGTIITVAVSVWITRYQVSQDRKLTRENFFSEKEFSMLDDVSSNIVDMKTAILIIVDDVTKYTKSFKDAGFLVNEELNEFEKNIKESQNQINKNYIKISNKLSEYALTNQEYSEINVNHLKKLLRANLKVKRLANEFDSYELDEEWLNRFKQSLNEILESNEILENGVNKRKSLLKMISA